MTQHICERILAGVQRVLLVIVGVVLFGLIMAALFGVARADAQSGRTCPVSAVHAPPCDPVTQKDRAICGAELKAREQLPSGATGEWRAWWWRYIADTSGTYYCSFIWAGLDKYAPKTLADYLKIADTVVDHPTGVTAGIAAAITAHSIKAPAGSQDEYDHRLLRYHACLALVAAPPNGVTWRAGEVPTCTAPTPPTAPPLSPYVVTASAAARPAYPVIAGKRSITAGGTATPGQPCDCAALQIIEFNIARYCAAPSIVGITGPAVTACSARPK